jgi:pimeloyl-ACP methyl ester carboxylesterase
MSKRVAIYIPGLGDKRRGFIWAQRQLLRTWSIYGFRTHIFAIDWASDQPFDERFSELLGLIDRFHAEGAAVALVGASAGASAVILGLIERPDKVIGVATICGQLLGTKALYGPAAMANPRFKYALARMQDRTDSLSDEARRRILTLRPKVDAIVAPEEATFPGGVNYRMPISGHLLGIGFGILFEGRRIAKFLKHASVSH